MTAESPSLEVVRFPPLRGLRRERLRRESEEARLQLEAGLPVRLTHVVELPPWERNGVDVLDESLRRLSPPGGEVARRCAPDLPVARVNHRAPGMPADAPETEAGLAVSAELEPQGESAGSVRSILANLPR